MGSAALISTDLEAPFSKEELAVASRAWESMWVPLRDWARKALPEPGSSEDHAVIAQFARIVPRLVDLLGPRAEMLVGFALVQGAKAIWKQAYEETATERKLGMRWTGEAFDTLFALLALHAPHARMPWEWSVAEREQAEQVFEQVQDWPESLRLLMRLEIETFVAFDLASLQDAREFLVWARRAKRTAEQAASKPPEGSETLPADPRLVKREGVWVLDAPLNAEDQAALDHRQIREESLDRHLGVLK